MDNYYAELCSFIAYKIPVICYILGVKKLIYNGNFFFKLNMFVVVIDLLECKP